MSFLSDFIGQGIAPNAANDLMQSIIKSYVERKAYSEHDIFMFIAFSKFVPGFDKLNEISEEDAEKYINKCNHFAFVCADHMTCLINKAKNIKHEETPESVYKKNIKIANPSCAIS